MIVEQLQKLSPVLLMSVSAGDEAIGSWASRALKNRYYGSLTTQDKSKVDKSVEISEILAETPKDQWRGYEIAIERMLQNGKQKAAYLVAPELLSAHGIDIYFDIFDPLRALELSIGYNPRSTSIDSRVNGMAIPKGLRELSGKLRFFQRGRANGDLMDEFQALLQTVSAQQAQAVALLNASFETEFGMRLPFQNNKISEHARLPDLGEVDNWLRTDRHANMLNEIAETDYGRVSYRDEAPTISGIDSRLNTLVVGFVDPGLAQSALTFKTLEMITARSLNIPGLNYYHFSQTIMAMRQFGFLNKE